MKTRSDKLQHIAAMPISPLTMVTNAQQIRRRILILISERTNPELPKIVKEPPKRYAHH